MGDKMVDPLPPNVVKGNVITIEDGTSTHCTLQKILECLRNQTIQKIGIWGMGGVGKTTVMKILNNTPEIEEMQFKFVIWVTVAKDYSIRKLQIEIAHRLSLELSNDESDVSVAIRLLQRLRTMRFLLLMDDVWDKVNLDDVGIPLPNQDNGCKVVLTTRHMEVCRKMETDEEIKVEPLSKEEAWKLFCEKVGKVVDSLRIKPLARRIVDECGGLPLAINVVGASLRKEGNIHKWENALRELSSPEIPDIYKMENVFKCLRFSFDELKDNNIKNCFLYVALYPEDYEIDSFELIEYWRDEGLINVGSSLVDARNKGHAILKLLIDASLLLQSDRSIYFVKMHDVIHDLALRITSPIGSGDRFLVRSNKKMEDPPENEEWEHVSRISLMQNELDHLLEKSNCPSLLTLLIQMNTNLRTVPESFFERMHAFRVLDLSEIGIRSLPPSISNLVSLRGLYLRHCYNLQTLPPKLGELNKLEVLNVQRTMLKGLPAEIGQLARLIVLQVAFSMWRDGVGNDVVVSRGTISRLSKLEQLSITIGSMSILSIGQQWDAWFTCAEEVVKDVSCLKWLTSLEFYFPEMEHFEHFIERSHPWKEGRFKTSNFIVGPYVSCSSSYVRFPREQEPEGWNRILTFCGCDIIPNAIVEVLSHANSFKLIGPREIHNLNEFGMQNMSGLIRCLTTECDKIEIFMEGHQLLEAALPNLERLVLSIVPNLRSIWEGSFPPGSLNCLRILWLSNCSELKNSFSHGIIHQLSNLEELTVENCSALEELFCEDAIVVGPEFFLPKLKLVCVSILPGLVRILKDHELAWTSLEVISVFKCHNLKKLPRGINKAPKLRSIMCEREWWNELEWDDNAIKLQLEPLFTNIEGC